MGCQKEIAGQIVERHPQWPGLRSILAVTSTREWQNRLACHKCRSAAESIPVVVLTTSDAESDIRRCYQLGASGYISKPMDIDQFISVIKSLGDYWINILKTPGSHG
ncbi:MAG: response regulator [Marinospirillum sp.]|nr:response regulator [Marinospirillum sp.]